MNSDWKKNNRLLPDDPALPGLAAIQRLGLARALPALKLGDEPVELINRGYTEGSRITLEARVGGQRFAVKAYADDPTGEAVLYQGLTGAGLGRDSHCQAPELLLWEQPLRVLVIGWLHGPSANELILAGHGARAGKLAAQWLTHVSALPVRIGPHYGPAAILKQQRRWVADLVGAYPSLGATATALAAKLESTEPQGLSQHLVHGTFYTRHIFDLGTGPGVIDWQRFGQGPKELDAGIFLATTWRTRLRPERPELEVARAEQSFLENTQGLLDEQALAWHRSAMLLRLASKRTRRQGEADSFERSYALLTEAARFAPAG
jgi:hypothetical protein